MRIPTYATYINTLNNTLRNKDKLDLYSYQSITGLKAQNYSGYGATAFNIVNFEASLNVAKNMKTNNDLLNIEITTMTQSMDSIYKLTNDYKSSLNSFSGMDLEQIMPDYTGGEITFSNDTIDDYIGKTLTIDGIQYSFAKDGQDQHIDLTNAKNGEDVMDALKEKLENLPNPPKGFEDFQFDKNTLKMPLYTINGSSSVLNVEGVSTGKAHLMNGEQAQSLKQLQQLAFSTMQAIVDSLNTEANGKFLFGGGESRIPPVNFPFSTLEEFQKFYNGSTITYPSSRNAHLSHWSFDTKNFGALEFSQKAGNPPVGVIKTKSGSFLANAVQAGVETTGNLVFDTQSNSIRASQYGAFNSLDAGDTLVINGNDAGNHAKTYVVKEVSEDGKTVIVEDSTPIEENATFTPDKDLTFSSSLPQGTVLNMEGFDKNISPQVQVTGVSADGSEIYVRFDPSRWPAQGETVEIPDTNKWNISSQSYYQGGSLNSERMISGNQTLTMDIKGSDPAFEKILRSLGEIAQGNLVPNLDPHDDFAGLIDVQATMQRVDEALELLNDGIYNTGHTISNKNADLNTVLAKINANYVTLDTTMKNQVLVQKNLEDSVSQLKTTDRTEAAAMSLMAAGNLDASYAVMQKVMNVSLLNYLK